MVSCLRSPSRAAFEFRMRSARCFGVYVSGAVKRRGVGPVDGEVDAVGWAHSEQNLVVGESWAPQLAHARARGAAHSSQNFAPGRLSCWHRRHFMRKPSGSRVGEGSEPWAETNCVGVAWSR